MRPPLRLAAAAALGIALLAGAARADDEPVGISAAIHQGYARVSFSWATPSACDAVLAGSVLTLHFARPLDGGIALIARRLPGLVASAAFGADHATVLLTLKKPVAVETFRFGKTVAVDLKPLPETAKTPAKDAPAVAKDAPPAVAATNPAKPPAPPAAAAPAAAHPVAAAPATAAAPAAAPAERADAIHLSVGRRDGAPRLVLTSRLPFDLRLGYQGHEVTITLPRALAVGRELAPLAALHPVASATTLTLTLPDDRQVERAGHGRRVVLDLVARRKEPESSAAASPAPSAAPPPVAAAAAVAPPAAAPAAAAQAAAVSKDPVVLSIGRGRRNDRPLVLSSRAPFDVTVAQTGREATVTASRPLAAPRGLKPLSGWQPRVAGTTLTLTLPEGRALARSEHNGRVVLDLVKAPPVAAAATPAAAPTPAPVASAAPPSRAAVVVPRTVKPVVLAGGGSLRFAPPPSAAAVFRRGRDVWVAFEGSGPMDLADVRAHGAPFVTTADAVAAAGATVLRFRVADGLEPSLRRSDSEWIVDLMPNPARPDTPVTSRAAEHPARLHFDVANAAAPVTVEDPTVGDRLVIVPLADIGLGVASARDMVDVQVLPTVQGLAFAPRSDGIEVARVADGVDLTSAQGLLVSDEVPTTRFLAKRNRIFDFTGWAGNGDLLAHRRELEQAIVDAKPGTRTWPRINLARFFVGIGYGAEARGVIAAIAREDPAAMVDPALRALRGVAALIAGDDDAAAADLATPLIENDPDLELWRGLLLADRGDLKGALPAFEHGLNVLPTYPPLQRRRIALAAAEARIAAGLTDEGLLRQVLNNDPTPGDRFAALYLEGKELAAHGDAAGALKKWDEVAAGDDRPSRAHAQFATTELLLATGKIDRPTAIQRLDGLRFAWRGGRFELHLLRRIGELKIADGDYRGGLAGLREATSILPQNPEAAVAQKELQSAFADLFIGPAAAAIPPLKALAVYEENRDLMPAGDTGDAITRKLADRLAAVDLLDRAAGLLDSQAKTRLSGVEKARVITRVAVLRLLDRKPAAALDALAVPVDSGLPPELATQRQELRARALLDTGKPTDSLAALDGDTTHAAEQLRAEIAVKTQDWATAAKLFAGLAGGDPPAGPLGTDAAQAVLNWAVALTLAQDHDGLAALREKYQAAMAKTPFADGFRIVAGADTANAADMRELTSRLAQVSDLQSFMQNYRQMVAKESLSAVN